LTREDGTDIVSKCRRPNTIPNSRNMPTSDHTGTVEADVFPFHLFLKDTQTFSPEDPVSADYIVKTITYSFTWVKLLPFLWPDKEDSAVI